MTLISSNRVGTPKSHFVCETSVILLKLKGVKYMVTHEKKAPLCLINNINYMMRTKYYYKPIFSIVNKLFIDQLLLIKLPS